jgi:hypothetical protein
VPRHKKAAYQRNRYHYLRHQSQRNIHRSVRQPVGEDHLSLQALVYQSTWTLFKARNLVSALLLLQQHEIAVVVCERDLLLGSFIDVLQHIDALPNRALLIVTSRLADEPSLG